MLRIKTYKDDVLIEDKEVTLAAKDQIKEDQPVAKKAKKSKKKAKAV